MLKINFHVCNKYILIGILIKVFCKIPFFTLTISFCKKEFFFIKIIVKTVVN